jgi:hypothetical protein
MDLGCLLPSLMNCRATSCPSVAQKPKAENILKTKGRERAFFHTKAENILKRNPLTKKHRNSEIA